MRSRRDFLSKALTVTGASLLACHAHGEDGSAWPTWRGPTRDGNLAAGALPTTLSDLKETWSVELADSYSGPIVKNGVVYTTETVERRDETLIALDSASGNQIWKKKWVGAMSVPFFAKSNGDWIRSTPAISADRIVVCGMRDVVACFDAKTGDEVWRIDFIKDHGAQLPSFGLVCSPLIDGDFVYVQAGGGVRKIGLADGALIWESMKDDGGMSGGAFSSPIIDELHGVRQLVVQTRNTVGGVDLQTGQPLWQRDIASFRGMNILTPTVWNDMVFTSCYGGKAQLIELDTTSAPWSTQLVWESKAEAYMSSPIAVDGHVYMHLKNNRFSCIDLTTGEEMWRTKPFGKYWSMLTDGKRILALDEIGELLLIEANPAEFTLIDRKTISDEPSWAHIALAGNQLFIRRQHGLDAYSLNS